MLPHSKFSFSVLSTSLILSLIGCKFFNTESNVTRNKSSSLKSVAEGAQDGKTGDPMVVMVMDDGFDSSHEVFKNKIIGEYTISCETKSSDILKEQAGSDEVSVEKGQGVDADDGDSDGSDAVGGFKETTKENTSISDEEMKKSLIESYKSSESSCKINKSIKFNVGSAFKKIEKHRDTWNKSILAKKIPSLSKDIRNEIKDILTGNAENVNYHGTSVASLIAYDNPQVKLVLVQITLGSSGSDSDASECPTQKSIDQFVRLLKDDEVRNAYIESPVDSVEKKLIELLKKHDVRLVNQSFGSHSRESIEKTLMEDGCGTIQFSDYFETLGDLDHAQSIYRLKKFPESKINALKIVSAGNDGTRMDAHADHEKCASKDEIQVIVGALDLSGKIAEFSNHGKCVDYYMLGEQVVAAAPADFLNVIDGTSFSTPLLVRYLTKNFDRNADTDQMKKFLKSKADGNRHLEKNTFPRELAFQSTDLIEVFALTDNSTKGAKIRNYPADPRKKPNFLRRY